MPSVVFVLCLTCLFSMKAVVMIDLRFSSSAHQHSDFLVVKTGDMLLLPCFFESEVPVQLNWYKQPQRQKPRLISSYNIFEKKITFYDELKNSSRFTFDTENNKNNLNISDLQASDSATYYCMSVSAYTLKFVEVTTVIVKNSDLNIPTLLHQSTSETIQPGGSVTLNCTVHTGTCDGEHSVYWFKNSAESQSGLIYTHGGSNDQCERKPDTQTHTCVYNLAMRNLSVSHAGIYYCAVISCGHILFGNATKLGIEFSTDEVYSPALVYMLSGALTFVTLLVVLLSVSLYKMKKTNSCQSAEPQARFLTSSTMNTQGPPEDYNLHYATLDENHLDRSRRQRNNTETECVYSSV